MTTAADGDDVARRATHVLRAAGVAGPFRIEPITGGGNNRVYRVDSPDGSVVLKVYFRHPDDPRDRLRADFGFSRFAWQVGTRALSQPLACDARVGMAVYEFVAGAKVAPGAVTAAYVAEAAAFFRAINEHRSATGAAELPEAAEACFSIADHVGCVDRRIARLGGIDAASPLGNEAAGLVARRLVPAWHRVRATVLTKAGTAADESLAAGDRCLNPSDFGFHNAIVATDGRLRFLDFEYAGHDDPAKMVCDFFCQPAVPVPREYLYLFLADAVGVASHRHSLSLRVGLLMPVYELKWCCIMLNDFLPGGDRRRTFASNTSDSEVRMAKQLMAVHKALQCFGH